MCLQAAYEMRLTHSDRKRSLSSSCNELQAEFGFDTDALSSVWVAAHELPGHRTKGHRPDNDWLNSVKPGPGTSDGAVS